MNRAIAILTMGLAIIGLSGQASATLIMNITDAGSGNTRFVFSGSATVLSGGSNANSIWVENGNFSSPFIVGTDGNFAYPVISGSGTVSSDALGGITGTVFHVYANQADGWFAPVTNLNIEKRPPGTVISWSGDLITNMPISRFAPGVYTTNTLRSDPYTTVLDSNYVLTIGPANTVPEPATLALLSLSLAGLGYAKRRKQIKAA